MSDLISSSSEVLSDAGKAILRALAGAIITKVDESVSLGGIIDVIIEKQLNLAYVSDGQQVPQDLSPACVPSLLEKAVQLANESPVNHPVNVRSPLSINLNMV